MSTFTVDKPEAIRKAVDRIEGAGETLVADAKLLKAKAVGLFDEGSLAAKKAYARKLRELDDFKDDTALRVRKAPLAAVGITFGAGLLLGALVGWIASRPSRP